MSDKMTNEEKRKLIKEKEIKPLVESGYISSGSNFFSLSGEKKLEELIIGFFGIEEKYKKRENKENLWKSVKRLWNMLVTRFNR